MQYVWTEKAEMKWKKCWGANRSKEGRKAGTVATYKGKPIIGVAGDEMGKAIARVWLKDGFIKLVKDQPAEKQISIAEWLRIGLKSQEKGFKDYIYCTGRCPNDIGLKSFKEHEKCNSELSTCYTCWKVALEDDDEDR